MRNVDFEVIDEGAPHATLYRIRPSEIPLWGESSGLSTFGTAEVELIAGHLLKFFKERGSWCSFTIEELEAFYRRNSWDPNQMFYGLIGWFVHSDGMMFHLYHRKECLLIPDPWGNYRVTNLFIERCARQLTATA